MCRPTHCEYIFWIWIFTLINICILTFLTFTYFNRAQLILPETVVSVCHLVPKNIKACMTKQNEEMSPQSRIEELLSSK